MLQTFVVAVLEFGSRSNAACCLTAFSYQSACVWVDVDLMQISAVDVWGYKHGGACYCCRSGFARHVAAFATVASVVATLARHRPASWSTSLDSRASVMSTRTLRGLLSLATTAVAGLLGFIESPPSTSLYKTSICGMGDGPNLAVPVYHLPFLLVTMECSHKSEWYLVL